MVRQICSLVLLTVFSLPGAAQAASGTWAVDANGNWSDTTKWVGGIVANGTGASANFTAEFSFGNGIVTVDSDRTIGNMTFSPVPFSYGYGWTLVSPTSVLTLASLSGTPTIAGGVGSPARIWCRLTGSQGLPIVGYVSFFARALRG